MITNFASRYAAPRLLLSRSAVTPGNVSGLKCVNSVQRGFATLLLAEQLNGNLVHNLGNLLKAAQDFKDPQVDVLVHGDDAAVAKQVEEVKKYPGISKIVVAKAAELLNP